MNYKKIDTKMKEIYYTPKIVENEELKKTDFSFWNSMRLLAVQNITIQNMQMA